MKYVLVILLSIYQKIISPILHTLLGIKSGCRNYPTCSAYATEVIMEQGAGKGTMLALRRIINCQPFFSI